MGIERKTTPELMRQIEHQRAKAPGFERELLDSLTKVLEGKRVRFKAPVYGRLIDFWCPTENLAVCVFRTMDETTATFEILRQNKVPVIFVDSERVRQSAIGAAREIMALRPLARLYTSPAILGRSPESSRNDHKGVKEIPQQQHLKGKKAPEPTEQKVNPGIPSAFMKPISNDLRPGRPFYALVLPNGKAVLHSDWVKFRSQFGSHKGVPAAGFDTKDSAESWIKERVGGGSKKKSKMKDNVGRGFEDREKPEALPDVEITDEYKAALDVLDKSKRNVFITGKAGTGKSTLLKYFKLKTDKKIAVLAPTGVAAVNVRGQTIHSFFQFPTQYLDPDLYPTFKGDSIHRKLDAIIIDEISMVRAEMFDAIEYFLRTFGPHPGQPFGGVQIICFGDPFQIPPVVTRDLSGIFEGQKYKSPYFFASKAFKQNDFFCLELSRVFRQREKTFVKILNQVRTGTLGVEGLRLLNTRVVQPDTSDPEPAMVLCPLNKTVNDINEARLAQLPGTPKIYQAEGSISYKELPVEKMIVLKKGAQVMLLRNNPEKGYHNGTIGEVTELGEGFIEVEIRKRNGKTRKVRIEPEEFEQVKHTIAGDLVKGRVIGSLKQIPVRLAWASTIHKSQGRTLDKVILDMAGGAFENGQTYVALSRCTSLEGLFLTNPIRQADIRVDLWVKSFHEYYFGKDSSEQEDEECKEIDTDFERALRRD
jgi:ATP-dependent DNA helicase PIF1